MVAVLELSELDTGIFLNRSFSLISIAAAVGCVHAIILQLRN